MNIFHTQKNTGFTLIEAMVAISILSIAITGPMVIAQKSIGSAVYARNQITASYLAQEGMEYVRNVKDSNSDSNEWLDAFGECEVAPGNPNNRCLIDARLDFEDDEDAIRPCSAGSCEKLSLYEDDASGQYIYGYGSGDGWKPSIFTRTISVDRTANPDREARVSVTVSWSTNLFEGVEPEFTIEEYIFNY